ncbi:MAG TPA: hypothetical protein VFT50_16115 [Baekduia sp.]|nr:hypothetical protein [Baekduia sp.]
MTDQHADPDAPEPGTEAEHGPAKAHGDAFLDQTGSRHGHPHERSEAEARRIAEAEARQP